MEARNIPSNSAFCYTNFIRHEPEPLSEESVGCGFFGTNFIGSSIPNNSNGCSNKSDFPTGCCYCRNGLKLPVYITMSCNLRCRYCPIDPKLLETDVCIVRGNIIENIDSIVEMCNGGIAGVSISGGEPLLKINKILHLVETLKGKYGRNFHIHMYTNATILTKNILKQLESVGLDEIRPSTLNVQMLRIFNYSNIEVTLETVALNYRKDDIKTAIRAASDIGINSVVLTEAEVNKFNADRLGDITPSSFKTACEIQLWAKENNIRSKISICTRMNAYTSACKREANMQIPGT